MSDAQTIAWNRMHSNGVIGIVYRTKTGDGPPTYSAGALPTGEVGPLETGFRTFAQAAGYADKKARRGGHECNQYCSSWPTEAT